MTPSNSSTPPPPPGFGERGKDQVSSETESSENLIEKEAKRLEEAAARAKAEAVHAPTDRLNTADQSALPEVLRSAYGYDIGKAEKFTPLPKILAAVRDRHDLKLWFWRIEFEGVAPGKGPIGMDLFSDAVIGRDPDSGEIVDIDLGPYEAFDKGVSRRHAMLRPTRNRLYLIDLDSTNGTRVNSLAVGQGRALEIHDGDTVTLGRLSFTVKFLLTPEQTAPDGASTIQEQTSPLELAEPFQKLPKKQATAPLDANDKVKKQEEAKPPVSLGIDRLLPKPESEPKSES